MALNQSEAIVLLEKTVIENAFRVREVLKSVVGIPSTILGAPESLRGYVNEQRALDFIFTEHNVFSTKGSFASKWQQMEPLSASFSPYPPSLSINTEVLRSDAEASGLNEIALLEILLLHELVHVSMMSRFVDDNESIWLKSGDLRFIHEAAALRAGEFAFSKIYKTANADDFIKYLTYVRERSEHSPDGEHYLPYFNRFRRIEADKFWRELSWSSPNKLPFL